MIRAGDLALSLMDRGGAAAALSRKRKPTGEPGEDEEAKEAENAAEAKEAGEAEEAAPKDESGLPTDSSSEVEAVMAIFKSSAVTR